MGQGLLSKEVLSEEQQMEMSSVENDDDYKEDGCSDDDSIGGGFGDAVVNIKIADRDMNQDLSMMTGQDALISQNKHEIGLLINKITCSYQKDDEKDLPKQDPDWSHAWAVKTNKL